MVECILFDLDNTLYPASAPFAGAMEERLNHYTARFLGLEATAARELRHSKVPHYGSTLQWLLAEHGFQDIEPYLEAVHPADVENYLQPDPDLAALLDRIPQRKVIFTNSPREHSERILDFLGIRQHFDRIFDIRYQNFRGKPYPESYTRILEDLELEARECLMLDDHVQYLVPFADLGGAVIHVQEAPRPGSAPEETEGLHRIRRVHEVEDWLRRHT